jgi:hypothetical protein
MTVAIIKDGRARIIIIMRPETIRHSRRDTFSQTASRLTQFFLHSGGGPYMFQQEHFGNTGNSRASIDLPVSPT